VSAVAAGTGNSRSKAPVTATRDSRRRLGEQLVGGDRVVVVHRVEPARSLVVRDRRRVRGLVDAAGRPALQSAERIRRLHARRYGGGD